MGFMIHQNNEKSLALAATPGPVTYYGLKGQRLLAAIVATGTVGFALFGYGE